MMCRANACQVVVALLSMLRLVTKRICGLTGSSQRVQELLDYKYRIYCEYSLLGYSIILTFIVQREMEVVRQPSDI